MRDILLLLWHLLVTVAMLLKPGGVRTVVAENLLMKHQLIVLNRGRQRAPRLNSSDRFLIGFWALFLNRSRQLKAAVIVKPSTLLRFHKALVQQKYHTLFSSKQPGKPGPKGPSQELINAIIAIKQHNPRFGCPTIAQQISRIFGIDIDKDVVRRVLEKHYHPVSGDDGPSWLTLLGDTKDSLWSRSAGPIDLFRCESINLKSHWVLLVMYYDPLFQYHRWKANLRMLDVEEIKSVPYQPLSHPFVERLIGTVRRELLDQTFFWNAADLHHFQWQSFCRGLFQLPKPA